MTEQRKSRLGRGLTSLIGDAEQATADQPPTEVTLDQIEENPYQPRKKFDDDELVALSDSIRNHGILQPLVVRDVGERYQLIAGERRLRAARLVGLERVPVRIVDFNDQQVLEAALVENIQRTDLNAIEKAEGFRDYLQRFYMTHETLAARLGVSRTSVTHLLALLDMPPEIQESIRAGMISLSHAKILKGITDVERQKTVAREIVARGLSVHATQEFLASLAEATPTPENADQADATTEPATEARESGNGSTGGGVEKTPHVLGIENELRQKLGVKFEIKLRGSDRGTIVLNFDSGDDFERIVEVLRR